VIRKNLGGWKNKDGNGYLKLYQTGGAVNDLLSQETAFVHRDSQWMADVSIDWKGDQSKNSINKAQIWQDRLYAEITRLAGGGAYQNFVDRSLNDWEYSYYGKNITRLRAIKQQVDPLNVFHFQQSIKA
jgi:hypothetical protein